MSIAYTRINEDEPLHTSMIVMKTRLSYAIMGKEWKLKCKYSLKMFYGEEYVHIWPCFIDYLDFKDEEIYPKFRNFKKNKKIWSLQVKAIVYVVSYWWRAFVFQGECRDMPIWGGLWRRNQRSRVVFLLWPLNYLSSNKGCVVKFGNECKRRKKSSVHTLALRTPIARDAQVMSDYQCCLMLWFFCRNTQ